MKSQEPTTYESSGVSPARATRLLEAFSTYLKARPRDSNIVSGIGPFASIYSLGPALKNLQNPMLVTCCDGVGTKLKLALDWENTSAIGTDLVAMNVNDLLCCGAQPLIFLDYFACGRIEHGPSLEILKSIQTGCELAGCSLVGGETAEMPGVYHGQDIDLAGFSVGVVDADRILGPRRVQASDRLVAIQSSGLHSNGYSLVRRLVDEAALKPNEATPFDGDKTWSQALLEPTTIYTKVLAPIIPRLHALAHVTGGGLFENLPRILPSGYSAAIRAEAWPWTPLFKWIEQASKLGTEQMLSTFNCGVGMIAISPENVVKDLIDLCKKNGIGANEIGHLVPRGASAPSVLWIEAK